jgi:hypothetical protein
LLPLLLLPIFACLLYANGAEQRDQAEQKIESLIQEFSERLGITADVIVAIVPKNSRLVSVEYAPEKSDAFRISFEQGFLNTLDDGEVRAAVAHEMGHIWIFTHFPYLHTEDLANQQALKLVSRGDLGGVYEKVREWNEKQVISERSWAVPIRRTTGSEPRPSLPARTQVRSCLSPDLLLRASPASCHRLQLA